MSRSLPPHLLPMSAEVSAILPPMMLLQWVSPEPATAELKRGYPRHYGRSAKINVVYTYTVQSCRLLC